MELFGWIEVPISLLLAVVILTLFYIYGSYPMKLWQELGVPGPPSTPFIGNFGQFFDPKAGMRASISKWQKQYGNVFGIYYFRKPCLVITDIDIVKDVLVKEFHTFYDRFFLAEGNFFPTMVNKGIFFRRGPDWKRIRRIMTATFTSGKLKTLTHHINKTARQLADKLQAHAKKGTRPVAKEVFGAYSLDVIAGTAFSLEINSQLDTSPTFVGMVRSIFKPSILTKIMIGLVGMFPFLANVFIKLNISVFNPKSVKYLAEYIGKLLHERRSNNNESIQLDNMQYLMDAEMDDSENIPGERKLTKDEVISQGITFLLAGYDTTSSALLSVVYLLIQNKRVQEKLIEEIERVVGNAEEISYDHCRGLTYLECVINETLRLYPPVVWLKRETATSTTIKGYNIPANTGIIIPVYNIGRDPVLFENPDSFNPDRFVEGNQNNSVTFLPFGFGPKACIGLRLAMLELKVALVHILRKVKFEDMSPHVLTFEDFTGILVPKQPLKLSVKLLNNNVNGVAHNVNGVTQFSGVNGDINGIAKPCTEVTTQSQNGVNCDINGVGKPCTEVTTQSQNGVNCDINGVGKPCTDVAKSQNGVINVEGSSNH